MHKIKTQAVHRPPEKELHQVDVAPKTPPPSPPPPKPRPPPNPIWRGSFCASGVGWRGGGSGGPCKEFERLPRPGGSRFGWRPPFIESDLCNGGSPRRRGGSASWRTVSKAAPVRASMELAQGSGDPWFEGGWSPPQDGIGRFAFWGDGS